MWNKLKLLWKARNEAKAVAKDIQELQKGYKTWQFWLIFVGHLAALLGAAQGGLDPQIALIANVVLAILYNFLRGVVKSQVNGARAWYKSTEFWLGMGVTFENAVMALKQGGVDPQWLLAAHSALVGVMAYAQRLGYAQPNGNKSEEK
jgi:hypothetical protein